MRPFASMSLQIEAVVVLQEAVRVQRPEKLKAFVWSPAADISHPCDKGSLTPPLSTSLASLEDMCAGLQCAEEEFKDFLRQPVGLGVPHAVLELAKRGVWKHLMLQGKWHHRCRGKGYWHFAKELDLPAWHAKLKVANLLNHQVPFPSFWFPASSAICLAKKLQAWAPSLINASRKAGKDEEHVNMFLEEMVVRLQGFGKLQRRTDGFSQCQKLSHDKVVKALCACLNLRNKSELSSTVTLAPDAAFPDVKDDLAMQMPSGPSLFLLMPLTVAIGGTLCCLAGWKLWPLRQKL